MNPVTLSLFGALFLFFQAPPPAAAPLPRPDTYTLGAGDQIVVRVPISRKSTTNPSPSI